MWDCEIEEEHYNALSGCCGSEEHSDVKGMCGACNEWSGWYCSMCDEDVSDDMYNWGSQSITLHSALGAVWGKPTYDDGDITIYQGGSE